jgi:hypothetical protein
MLLDLTPALSEGEGVEKHFIILFFENGIK